MTNIPRLGRRPQAGRRRASAFVLGLVMVGTGVSGPAGGHRTLSAQALNPCTLLTVDEIQSLEWNASTEDGVPGSLPDFGSAMCRYAWGAGINRLKLGVVVNESSRMFPGMSPEQIKQRLLGSVKADSPDAIIPDVGEAAVFTADSAYYATATASIKGRIIEVSLDGLIARDMKDQVIALLKSAASRL